MKRHLIFSALCVIMFAMSAWGAELASADMGSIPSITEKAASAKSEAENIIKALGSNDASAEVISTEDKEPESDDEKADNGTAQDNEVSDEVSSDIREETGNTEASDASLPAEKEDAPAMNISADLPAASNDVAVQKNEQPSEDAAKEEAEAKPDSEDANADEVPEDDEADISPDHEPDFADELDKAPMPPYFTRHESSWLDIPSTDASTFSWHLAHGTPQDVQNLITNYGLDPNMRGPYEVTPLILAAKENPNPDVVRVLFRAGANIKAADKAGMTALMYAAFHNPVPEVTLALLECGADVSAKSNNRRTALIFAARHNNAKVIKALLDAGSDVDTSDKFGWTALICAACYTTEPEVITVLLDAGSNPRARGNEGERAIDYARNNPKLSGTQELMRLESESR